MNKKLFTLVSLLLLASMALSACGPAVTEAPATEAPATSAPATEAPATEAPAEPAEATTITMWHQWTGDYLTAIEQAFKDYEASHPNVKIELSKPEDVTAALQVAIPAGEGPDIIAWANDQIGKNALAGNIVALDDYGVDQALLTGTYEPAAVQGVIWQDKIWALPETQEGIAFIYNQDLVTDEYLPTNPTDFDDILAKAQKFYEDTGMPLFCNQGFKGADAYHIGAVFFGFGVPSYVDDQGNVTVDTPEALEAMNWLLDVKPYLLQDADDEACRTAVKEGQAGGQWGGPWLLADFESAGVNYGVTPLGKPFVGIKVVMLTKNAVDRGNQDVALDIMKYYTSPEVQAKLALVNKTIPAQTTALADPEVAALPSLVGFGEALNSGVPMANTPFADAQWGPVGDAVGAIWNGSQTPEEALAAAQTAIEAKVAEMQ